MTDQQTPRLNLPYLASNQAQKHVTLNESLSKLDALVGLTVTSRSITDPPGSPAEGDAYLMPTAARTGAWSAFSSDDLAVFRDGTWQRFEVPAGLTAKVQDEGVWIERSQQGWSEMAGGGLPAMLGVDAIGVGTAPDTTRPLAMTGNLALLSALDAANGGTGDIRLTLNRETGASTSSIVLQTGFQGVAEIGLAGDERLSFRLSADGLVFETAMSLDIEGSVWMGSALNFTQAEFAASAGAIVLGNSQQIQAGAAPGETSSQHWIEYSAFGFWHFVQSGASVLQISDYWVHSERRINTAAWFQVAGQRVVGPRQPAIADLPAGAPANDVITTINDILTRLRTHGLIGA